jgi:hypothetical protein
VSNTLVEEKEEDIKVTKGFKVVFNRHINNNNINNNNTNSTKFAYMQALN